MADVGNELGVDLGELWLCARSYLPRVADAFLSGNAAAADTATADGAFGRYGTIPGAGIPANVPGPVYPAWAAARDELQRVMAETAANTYAACDALVRVADLYASTDSEAAAKFRQNKLVYEHDSTLSIDDPSYYWLESPGQRPSARMPGQVHG